jgi:hypothetical protein
MNWLTDDNIEFILKSFNADFKSSFSIEAGDVEVRTDIANIYNAFFNAKNRLSANEFVNDTKLTKKYTIFPVRVSGNHWGMFIIEKGELSDKDQKQVEEIGTQALTILDAWKDKSNGDEKEAVRTLIRILSDDDINWVRQCDELTNLLRIYPNQGGNIYNLARTWENLKDKFSADCNAYYTSSGSGVKKELETVKPLITALTDNIIANNATILAGQKQTDAYNCGVYLLFYIEEILATQKPKLTRTYSEKDIADFRQFWKNKIGEDKWCKEDKHGEEDVGGDDWSKLGINAEQKKEWFDEDAPQGKKGFGIIWVEKLLNFGFKPDEGKFANWLKNKLENWGYSIGELTNFTNLIKDNLTNYRLEYQNLEKPPFSPPKPTKPKKETPHDYSLNRNSQCKICAKRTFYSKAEFAQAHRGIIALEPSVWVYKEIYICKNPIITKQMWICRICKQEKHTDKCKYYSPLIPIIPIPEPFDWEGYWKWWFGTSTLDWDSKRFFGSH